MPGTVLLGWNAAVPSRCDSRYVPSQGELADVDERVVAVGPHLGQVERVEAVRPGLVERHDLHVERPAGSVTRLDGVVEVPLVVVSVLAGDAVGIGLGEELNPLVGLEVILHPETLALCIDPHVGV